MLKLYHAPRSRSSRIIWLLEELGAEYEIVYTEIVHSDGSGAPDANNPHPDKKVPALSHNGAVITESAAITLYLTDLFPEAGIAPKVGDPDRGAYLTWLFYYAGVMEPVVTFQFLGLAEHEGLAHSYRGRAELDKRILDALNSGSYLIGNTFSAADILLASVGQWSRNLLPAGDVMDAYLERCNARPALQAANAKDDR